MVKLSKFTIYTTSILFAFLLHTPLYAQEEVFVDASNLVPDVQLLVTPKSGSFIEGSTFQVPIIINTKGSDINTIDLKVSFDPTILSVVKPAGGQSIIAIWVDPPSFDNVRGKVSYVGLIPNGIVTDSGLVGTITFQARRVGRVAVSIQNNSNVLLNDGFGTYVDLNLGRAEYTVIGKAPEGVNIFSETHPFSGDWYNNNSPIFTWDKDPGVDGFSFVFDNKPLTIPDNTVDTADTIKGFSDLNDGLWYFHIKANKNGVWGSTGHYMVRIDTAPPALFKLHVEHVVASAALIERTLVSFFTTDSLSGMDHYEVGVIDKSDPITESPAFVYAESPFQVPIESDAGIRVIVRAVDRAGNIRDVSVDIGKPNLFIKLILDFSMQILIFIIVLMLIGSILHYFMGHHIVSRFKRRASNTINRDLSYTEKSSNTGKDVFEP